MNGLGLVPNEVVGWRIKPDWHNYTIVLVKCHGTASKKVGQEYEEPVAYCATLQSAVTALIQRATRYEAERQQDVIQAATGSIASAEGLRAAIDYAQAEALKAVAALEQRLTASGLKTPKQVTHFLGGRPPADTEPESDAQTA